MVLCHNVQLAKFQLHVLMKIVWKIYDAVQPCTDDGVCGEDANRAQCVQLSIDGYRIQIQLIYVPTGPTTLNILL